MTDNPFLKQLISAAFESADGNVLAKLEIALNDGTTGYITISMSIVDFSEEPTEDSTFINHPKPLDPKKYN